MEEPAKPAKKVKLGFGVVLGLIALGLVVAVAAAVVINAHNKTSNEKSRGFSKDFSIVWAENHTRISDNGNRLELTLDQESGSGFKSKDMFLFGSIKMDIKLVPDNSAGTVTAYYITLFEDVYFSILGADFVSMDMVAFEQLSSLTSNHDELDFEFLGNSSGEPYILQTNVFANGTGEREQRIFLWFDPTTDYHTYGVLWNHRLIVFLVDDLPIRMFTNNEMLGMAFPNQQPMNIFSSIWNGDKWATRGGRVKIDWSHAPFVASYQNYHFDACVAANMSAHCASTAANRWWDRPEYQTLSAAQQDRLRWVEENYMVYNYCFDVSRNPVVPFECSQNSAGYIGIGNLH